MSLINLNLHNRLRYITKTVINKEIVSLKKISSGYYGNIFLAETNSTPKKFIAKVYKKTGYIESEQAQLNELRKYSLVHVPEIFGISLQKQNGHFDVLFMEYIDAVNASHIKLSSQVEKDRLRDEIVDNLLAIHSASNPNGFGDFVTGEYYERWESFYKKRINTIYDSLKKAKPFRLSAASEKIADSLFESFDTVFSNPVKKNSLIHGDYNLWNLMVDPNTNHLVGVIDPLNCCYGDRELELFQLENANGNEYSLLSGYSKKVQLSDNFELKNAYYRFWDDIKHLVNAGYCDNKAFKHYGQLALNLLNNQ